MIVSVGVARAGAVAGAAGARAAGVASGSGTTAAVAGALVGSGVVAPAGGAGSAIAVALDSEDAGGDSQPSSDAAVTPNASVVAAAAAVIAIDRRLMEGFVVTAISSQSFSAWTWPAWAGGAPGSDANAAAAPWRYTSSPPALPVR